MCWPWMKFRCASWTNKATQVLPVIFKNIVCAISSNLYIVGIKDTENLIKYIPNMEKFRLVAQFIRHWAKSKSQIQHNV